jgi:hypothetical protein
MSLEEKCLTLKALIKKYDTEWLLGDLSGHIKSIGQSEDEIRLLSSPLRQLYFLGGLLLTSKPCIEGKKYFERKEWDIIVDLLVEIEKEYDKLLFPNFANKTNDIKKQQMLVSASSFLTYFNQGPLNFEEQPINWVRDIFTKFDTFLEFEIGLKTEDFIDFYNRIDTIQQNNFRSFCDPKFPIKNNWRKNIRVEVTNTAPAILNISHTEKDDAMFHYLADYGIINRFTVEEIISDKLSLDKIMRIINLLKCKRSEQNFIYYTSTKPSNPLYDKPIVDVGKGVYQILEVKQIIHAIENLLESICSNNIENESKLNKTKGNLLEDRICELFSLLLKKDFKIYREYYVDGNEQDILILYKSYAFIIEAKGYNIREPLRDSEKAFERIKDDFKKSIGYGYIQTQRVAQKFISQSPLIITDKKGNVLEEIDTTIYKDHDFSIIVNIKSFGQIQNDLSMLLTLKGDSIYPWAVRFDDLEVFILTMLAQNKTIVDFINYLQIREDLHGKLICSDESEVMGGFLIGKITIDVINNNEMILTKPNLADIFDIQYRKGLNLKNEKLLKEKKSGKYIFM